VSVVPVREAATVLVVRDGHEGLEVLMLRRTTAAVFSPGAHVFPGGALDDDDRSADLASCCASLTEADASVALGVPAGGLGYFVAAVRECFEEAGVMLARGLDGELLRLDNRDVARRFEKHRRAVHSGERRLVDVCAEESLDLAVDALHPFGHWITPPGGPRRFDTRFFITEAPAAQEAVHDDHETTEHGWFRPADILAAHRRGEVILVRPTEHSLWSIADARTVADVVPAVAA
jgi:8-oxo-dGTP pyrophosphatase MutT (NUDIX family)